MDEEKRRHRRPKKWGAIFLLLLVAGVAYGIGQGNKSEKIAKPVPATQNTVATVTEQSQPSTQATTMAPTEPPTQPPTEPEADMVDGMHRDFKEAMDTYRAFFDEYIEFMNNYMSSGNVVALMGDYLNYMSKYSEMMEKLDAWESEDMNEIEAAYYLDTMNEINKKLVGIAF